MVLRQQNGDLVWQQDGMPVSVSKDQYSMYPPADETEVMQAAAAKENTAASDAYMEKLQAAQDKVDAGKAVAVPPVKPKYILVTDPVMIGTTVTAGVKSEASWPAPGLPELQPSLLEELLSQEKVKATHPEVPPTPPTPPPTPPPQPRPVAKGK